MTWVVAVSASMLAVGALLAMVRVGRGPSVLDRIVALDVMTNVLIIGVAVDAAWNRRTDTIPVLAALALTGFTASVGVARFSSFEPEDVSRIKTLEEVRAEQDARDAAEVLEAHLEAEATARREEQARG